MIERVGKSFLIEVGYENLPSFCSTCSSFGHLPSEYKLNKKDAKVPILENKKRKTVLPKVNAEPPRKEVEMVNVESPRGTVEIPKVDPLKDQAEGTDESNHDRSCEGKGITDTSDHESSFSKPLNRSMDTGQDFVAKSSPSKVGSDNIELVKHVEYDVISSWANKVEKEEACQTVSHAK